MSRGRMQQSIIEETEELFTEEYGELQDLEVEVPKVKKEKLKKYPHVIALEVISLLKLIVVCFTIVILVIGLFGQ